MFTINLDAALKLYPFPADTIKNRMREILITNNPQIDSIMDYLLQGSGKMLRPRLAYLSASLYPHDPLVMRDMAVAVEMIHLASLVHDDVIDHALTRRGRESANSRWGNKTSILTGDYLFAASFNLINRYNFPRVMDDITRTIKIMCAGEIKQLSLAFDLDISEEDYFSKTYSKTACLFASSCKVGALISSAPDETAKLLEQYGLYLGYAYQIIDDILDIVSDSKTLGKPAGSDLLEGNITLPIIFALRDDEYGLMLKQMLQNNLNTIDLYEVKTILLKSRAIEYALSLSRQFLRNGLACLEHLPARPAIQELQALAVYILEEYYGKLSQHCEIEQKTVVN